MKRTWLARLAQPRRGAWFKTTDFQSLGFQSAVQSADSQPFALAMVVEFVLSGNDFYDLGADTSSNSQLGVTVPDNVLRDAIVHPPD